MPVTRKPTSVSGYGTNNNPSQSTSSVVCRPDSSSYPLQSIVVSNIGSPSGATLTPSNQPNSIVITGKVRGSVLVFENPPVSQSGCYSLNFPSQNPGVNNMKVQFIDNRSNPGQGARSTGSNNLYGSYSPPYAPNTYSG